MTWGKKSPPRAAMTVVRIVGTPKTLTHLANAPHHVRIVAVQVRELIGLVVDEKRGLKPRGEEVSPGRCGS